MHPGAKPSHHSCTLVRHVAPPPATPRRQDAPPSPADSPAGETIRTPGGRFAASVGARGESGRAARLHPQPGSPGARHQPSTLRRLLPYIETIELPWGTSLIPVDELERIAIERRQTVRPRLEPPTRGRKLAVAPEVAKRILDERSTGRSLRQIAANLNADGIPTAHGGAQWWPSTVRHVLQRSSL